MYKIVVTMTFAWPQLSFSKDTTLVQGVFMFHWSLSFSKDISPFQRSLPFFKDSYTKEGAHTACKGRPASSGTTTTGWSFFTCSFQKIEHAFSKAVGAHLAAYASRSFALISKASGFVN